MIKPSIFHVKFDRLSVMFFYYLKLYPDFRSFTLKDLKIKIPAYRPAEDIDIETRIDAWKVSNAIELEENINDTGETEYKILKIDTWLEGIDIYHEIEEEVSVENALKWIEEAKEKVYKRKAAQAEAFEGVLLKLAESEKVNDLKKRKENFVKWYENRLNPLRYYNVENPSELANKLSQDSKCKQKIPVSFSHLYMGKCDIEEIVKDACVDRYKELIPIEVLVEKINELEMQKSSKRGNKKKSGSPQENKPPKFPNHSLKPTQIDALYEALIDRYIAPDTTLEQFQALFDSTVTEMVTPIQWTESNRLLVYLLEKIFKRWQSYFERKKAFVNKDTKPLTASDYSTALNDSKSWGEPNGYKQIDAIIDSISKQNI